MSVPLKEKIKTRMEELGIQPKRSLGQNFLVSDGVVQRILAAAEAEQFDEVFEIGPGLGALTDDLAACNSNLHLLEMDSAFANYWREKEFTVHEGDALKHRWDQLTSEDVKRLLVSNLPYQISARIVVDFSVEFPIFDRMVLMFQKEVAQRIQADPGSGDYGLLSVVAQTYWTIHKVSEAGAVDFFPKPNVASRVLRFEVSRDSTVGLNHRDYLKFLKLCFANRRKVLLPKLTVYKGKEELSKLFATHGIDPKIRVESLSWTQLLDLYRDLKKG